MILEEEENCLLYHASGQLYTLYGQEYSYHKQFKEYANSKKVSMKNKLIKP